MKNKYLFLNIYFKEYFGYNYEQVKRNIKGRIFYLSKQSDIYFNLNKDNTLNLESDKNIEFYDSNIFRSITLKKEEFNNMPLEDFVSYMEDEYNFDIRNDSNKDTNYSRFKERKEYQNKSLQYVKK